MKAVIGTVWLVAVLGRVKAVTVGGVELSVMVVAALTGVEILPAASFAQAYAVCAPELAKVTDVGADVDHEHPEELFVVLTQYPVTPTLSVAVNVVIGTVRLDAVEGMMKPVTEGGVVSLLDAC